MQAQCIRVLQFMFCSHIVRINLGNLSYPVNLMNVALTLKLTVNVPKHSTQCENFTQGEKTHNTDGTIYTY